ncbi:MAG: dihydropteroate synthase [Beijerinckiaceae bacterium]|nr:MAG: dihydropteroate synthase [Beijerinckiaceae bacterium]
MGILNVTPDSFSDGGKFQSRDAALAQAQKLVAEGADVIDIGAESTRPGHTPVPQDVELARLATVLPALVQAIDTPISIDTSKAAVARYAISTGVAIVNDVWGLQKDPAMADTVAEGGTGVVIMHNCADVDPNRDVLSHMRRFLDHSLALADKAGIPRERIILDPGIGFGKTKEQNIFVLHRLEYFLDYGLPLLVGISRKSLLGAMVGSEVESRLAATLAANLAAAAHGASIFRVHDAAAHVAAFKVFDAIQHA